MDNVQHRGRTPLVISFYTVDTPYQQEVSHLIRSCETLGIEALIEGKQSRGSWESNCAMKPFFILEKLEQTGRSVLWVDADAVFLQPPSFEIFSDCDFSVRISDYLDDTEESKVISNTVYVRNSKEGKEIVRKWAEESHKQLNMQERVFEFWDQVALREVLKEKGKAKVYSMPLAYAKIFDLDDLFIPESEVVLEHRQASRRFKGQI